MYTAGLVRVGLQTWEVMWPGGNSRVFLCLSSRRTCVSTSGNLYSVAHITLTTEVKGKQWELTVAVTCIYEGINRSWGGLYASLHYIWVQFDSLCITMLSYVILLSSQKSLVIQLVHTKYILFYMILHLAVCIFASIHTFLLFTLEYTQILSKFSSWRCCLLLLFRLRAA